MRLKHGLIETRCSVCGALIARSTTAVEMMRQRRDGVPEIAKTTEESLAQGLCAECWQKKKTAPPEDK